MTVRMLAVPVLCGILSLVGSIVLHEAGSIPRAGPRLTPCSSTTADAIAKRISVAVTEHLRADESAAVLDMPVWTREILPDRTSLEGSVVPFATIEGFAVLQPSYAKDPQVIVTRDPRRLSVGFGGADIRFSAFVQEPCADRDDTPARAELEWIIADVLEDVELEDAQRAAIWQVAHEVWREIASMSDARRLEQILGVDAARLDQSQSLQDVVMNGSLAMEKASLVDGVLAAKRDRFDTRFVRLVFPNYSVSLYPTMHDVSAADGSVYYYFRYHVFGADGAEVFEGQIAGPRLGRWTNREEGLRVVLEVLAGG